MPHRTRSLLMPLAFVHALLAAAGCHPDRNDARVRTLLESDSMGVAPGSVRAIAIRTRRSLVENSGAAWSAAQPAVMFTINDSGNEPELFAIDSAGADRGAWRIAGATNRDWEAIAPGPCPDSSGAATPAARRCLYIGDIGDNEARRAALTLYLVHEPTARDAGYSGTLPARARRLRYADGAHDVEAMYVGPAGTMFFITKRELTRGDGSRRPALVFTLPPTVWDSGAAPAVAELRDSLPAIVPGSAIGRQVTDAALSPDSRYVAVRTYTQLYIFAADPATGAIRTAQPPSVCNIVALEEKQGEGITWLGDSRQLVLTSEGHDEPLQVVGCGLPDE